MASVANRSHKIRSLALDLLKYSNPTIPAASPAAKHSPNAAACSPARAPNQISAIKFAVI